MTDLEMTKACAEAMGYAPYRQGYAPLFNDAQAMALVKEFRLTVVWTEARLDGWRVRGWHTGKTGALCEEADANDLNRAIVECVAKMKMAKAPPQ